MLVSISVQTQLELPFHYHFYYLFYYFRGVAWNSPKNSAKPGSTGWTPQPMAATTGAGYRPMVKII